jgi:hypothetical protein
MPRSIPIGPRSPLEHVEPGPICHWHVGPHGFVGYQDGHAVVVFTVAQFPRLIADLAKALDEAGR